MNETAVSTSGITSSILIIDEDKMISDLRKNFSLIRKEILNNNSNIIKAIVGI